MKDTFHKLIIGVVGPTTGYVISISVVEQWLRLLSLVIGCVVGLASFISICLSIRRKYRNWRKESSEYEEEETTIT